jgi:hypothetical protein
LALIPLPFQKKTPSNLLGTWWEPIGNMKGTMEKRKNPTPNFTCFERLSVACTSGASSAAWLRSIRCCSSCSRGSLPLEFSTLHLVQLRCIFSLRNPRRVWRLSMNVVEQTVLLLLYSLLWRGRVMEIGGPGFVLYR